MVRIRNVLGMWAAAAVVVGCGGGSGSATTACATAAEDGSLLEAQVAVASDGLAARAESMRRVASGNEVSPIQPRSGQQVPTAIVSLGELSLARRNAAAAQVDTLGVPRQIGLARDLQQTASVPGTLALLDWQATVSGSKVAAIRIESGLAQGVRLGVLVRSLPAEAILRVYAPGSASAYVVSGQEVLATVQRNLAAASGSSDAARMFWTPMVAGTEATLEIELPAQTAADSVQIAIPRLAHIYASPLSGGDSLGKATGVGAAGSCEVDAACNSSYSAESNAVAKISFIGSDGVAYLCSGALVADTAASASPYFLSANHCISQQSEASTLESYWFYRAATCGSGSLGSGSQTVSGGATLLYASSLTDTSFMRLGHMPPTGAVYAGWAVSASPSATSPALNAAVAGVHHPAGDLQKISTGTITGYRSCTALDPATDTFSCSTATSTASFVNVTYTSGVTEGGSSGSPLFQTSGSSHYLVGQLYGGSSSCTTPSGSNIYGRFDLAYNAALSPWLNPGASVSLSVNKLGNGAGTVSSSPAGISCGTSCTAPFATNGSVTLTAAPASGSSFTGWGGACSGTGSTCTLTMDAGKAATATFAVPVIALAAALDDSLVWTSGGDAGFFGQTSTANVGTSAAQSGAITHNQSSTLSTTLTGPGTLVFDWKVSSQAGSDILSVAVDGVVQTALSISGEKGWFSNTLAIASGSHTVVWTYAKNASHSAGSDAAWVDNVAYVATAPVTTSATTPTVSNTCTAAKKVVK